MKNPENSRYVILNEIDVFLLLVLFFYSSSYDSMFKKEKKWFIMENMSIEY